MQSDYKRVAFYAKDPAVLGACLASVTKAVDA